MEIKEFLKKLAKHNFSLIADGNRLILKADKNRLTDEDIDAVKNNKEVTDYIRNNKELLIEYLSNAGKRAENVEAIYRLSALQAGMLFHNLYEKETGAYRNQLKCDLYSADTDAFRKSWQSLLVRHSILRSSIHYDSFRIPVQCVHQEVEMPVEIIDYRNLKEKEQQDAVHAYEEEDYRKGFDFTRAPLMRVTLLRLTDTHYRMLWTSHHILFDGWSMPILMEEFLTAYDAFATGKAPAAIAEDCYEDYIRYVDKCDKKQEEAYWRKYLDGIDQPTWLPFIPASTLRNKGVAAFRQDVLIMDELLTSRIEDYAKRHRITINTFMQSVWSILLHIYTGRPDVTFGVVVSGRPEDLSEVERRVGMYINTLPLRSIYPSAGRVTEWLQDLQRQQMRSREFQYTPLNSIQRWSAIQGDLFDSIIVFQNYPVAKIVAAREWQLKVENIVGLEQTSNYPLLLRFVLDNTITLRLIFKDELLNPLYVEQIKLHFEKIILQLLESDDLQVTDIRLPAADFNFTTTAAEGEHTLISLFAAQVESSPEAVAITAGNEVMTYRELNEKANCLANVLESKGVGPDVIVPVCTGRTPHMIVAILGIMKAGGAYVPIDPTYPEDRIAFILADTAARIAVVENTYHDTFHAAVPGVEIIDPCILTVEQRSDWEGKTVLPAQLAYVIYTSGSTGKPKGVMVEHRNIANFIRHQQRALGITQDERILQLTNYCFDPATEQIFTALLSGATLVLLPQHVLLDPDLLGDFLYRQQITHLHATPGILRTITPGKYNGLRRVIAGGELCNKELAEQWKGICRFYNKYGPTEAAVSVSQYLCKEDDSLRYTATVPIGNAVAGTRLYVLDEKGLPVGIGVAGELYIGGVQLARGYLNNEKLTIERFLTDPFQTEGRMYRTGDIVRWLPDANLEYIGRADEQVKLRGYRIEPGEIEHVLQQAPSVQQCAVVAAADSLGNMRLIGYVVTAEAPDKEAILAYLQRQLPAYMIPAYIVDIEKIPLNANGKTDKKALAAFDNQVLLNGHYEAPGNEIEQHMCTIWQEVLGQPQVGILDNFFGLGGDSIITIQVVSRCRKLGYDIQVGDLFTHQTISRIATVVQERMKVVNEPPSLHQQQEELQKYAASKALLHQKEFWNKTIEAYRPFPADEITINTIVNGSQHFIARQHSAQTEALLHDVHEVYHTTMEDLLLAALAKTLCTWSGREQVVIGIHKDDGKEGVRCPVLLSLDNEMHPERLIKSIKEQLRKVPDGGLGYGVLKYIVGEEKLQHDCWDLLFMDSKFTGISTTDTKEKIRLEYEMEGHDLVFKWDYNSSVYTTATIRKLSESFLFNLDFIIDHCRDLHKKGVSENTPSDYGLSDEVSYQELQKFLQEPVEEGKTRQQLISDCYRLSGLQAGMLFHSLYDEDALTYRNQLKADLTDVNLNAFRESWEYILERHSILRSSIHADVFKVPVQCVYKKVTLPLQIIDFRHLVGEEQQAAVYSYEEQDRKTGFDFTKAPLMRVILLQLADNRYRMLWTSHHILHDGWSLPVLMEEFLTVYDAKVTGSTLEQLPEDRYEDYIRYVEKRDTEKDEEYWRTYLKEVQQGTLMPFVSSSVKRTKGIGRYKEEVLHLDESVALRISDFAKSRRITVNTLMQAVWSFLLHKYTGKQDIVFGTVVSGRPEDLPGIEHRVGMYINTLPLRSSLRQEEKVDDWLQRVLKGQVASRQHQHTPLTEIQRLSGVQGDLFDSIMVFQNFPVSAIVSAKNWQLKVEDLDVQEQANYPFYITVGAFEEINVHFFYNTLLLDVYYVQQIKRHFKEVLSQILQNGQSSVSDLHLLNDEERQQVLYDWNNTAVAYTESSSTLVALFETRAALTPGNPAIITDDCSLDFHTLNEQANRLANCLREKGVTKDTLVPVCMLRSTEMLIGILGVLKAGAAYVPVDPAYPSERIAYILKDTRATIVLTASPDSEPQVVANSGVSVIRVREVISSGNSTNPALIAGSADLAYVIYTSGSTGTPKGVMVEHGSLTNYLLNSRKRYTDTDNAASGSYLHLSYTFDAAITAMFVPLISGTPVVLPSAAGVSVFEEQLFGNNAPYDFIKLTPAHLPLLAGQQEIAGYPFTRRIISGGEALIGEQLSFLADLECAVEILNEYGPTEATVGCAVYSLILGDGAVPSAGAVPIGKPMENVKLYILDADREPVPVGATGELYIGGIQVARGYLNQPELTTEKFLQNPFDSGRIYRTGDLARWLPNGNIEYLGRADEQVKIRGYRIEPAEIEAAIRDVPGVQDARILIIGNGEDTHKRICAFVVGDKPDLIQDVQSQLQLKLPEYMQPNQFFQPASFPLNSHGKLDRRALLQLAAEHVVVEPRNELETTLVRIWKDLLEIEQVGVKDTFFSLGGDSLLAIRLISVIKQELKLEVTISKLFDLTTIEEQAKYLGQQQENLVSEEDYETIRL